MRNEVLAGCVASTTCSTKGFGEEEVLHVDNNEGRFGGIDCDRDGSGFDSEFRCSDRVRRGNGMRQVKPMCAVMEPEV